MKIRTLICRKIKDAGENGLLKIFGNRQRQIRLSIGCFCDLWEKTLNRSRIVYTSRVYTGLFSVLPRVPLPKTGCLRNLVIRWVLPVIEMLEWLRIFGFWNKERGVLWTLWSMNQLNCLPCMLFLSVLSYEASKVKIYLTWPIQVEWNSTRSKRESDGRMQDAIINSQILRTFAF